MIKSRLAQLLYISRLILFLVSQRQLFPTNCYKLAIFIARHVVSVCVHAWICALCLCVCVCGCGCVCVCECCVRVVLWSVSSTWLTQVFGETVFFRAIFFHAFQSNVFLWNDIESERWKRWRSWNFHQNWDQFYKHETQLQYFLVSNQVSALKAKETR